MGPEGSLMCSQEPDHNIIRPFILVLISFAKLFFRRYLGRPSVLLS